MAAQKRNALKTGKKRTQQNSQHDFTVGLHRLFTTLICVLDEWMNERAIVRSRSRTYAMTYRVVSLCVFRALKIKLSKAKCLNLETVAIDLVAQAITFNDNAV